jgi:hypothetical protein
VIGKHLIDMGYGTDPEDTIGGDWPIRTARETDRPDDLIRITDTVGRDFGYTQIDGERQEHNGFQVMVRAADYEEGFKKAQAIAVYLDTVAGVAVTLDEVGTGTEGVNYVIHSISRTSSVFALGSDTPAGKREMFSFNGTVALRMCC